MNYLKIEVPEGQSLQQGTIMLNGQELKGVVKLTVAAYPHMALPMVNITLRTEVVQVDGAEITWEDTDDKA